MTRGNASRGFALCAGLVLAAALGGCSSQPSTVEPLTWEKVAGPGPHGAVLGLGSAGAFDEVGNF
ncbi:MAG TPA: hypothetical protein VFP52_08040, partial [Myxococcales bacterium]|nr:hypothetical protein [Myxococcales bacterium]